VERFVRTIKYECRTGSRTPQLEEGPGAVYRRRIRGASSQRLLRLRGERVEHPLAHLYEAGGMRRVYLPGHANIRKELLIHTPPA